MDGEPVRVVVDDDGRLVELVLSRELLAAQPWTVSRAIVAAVNEAQDAVRVRHEHLADRRLAEFGTLVSDLMRRQMGTR